MSNGLEDQIGRRVAAFRNTAGLTQERLAERVGVTVETISRLERGTSIPSISRLASISEAVGIELGQLFSPPAGETDKEKELDAAVRYLSTLSAEDIRMIHDIARRIFDAAPKSRRRSLK